MIPILETDRLKLIPISTEFVSDKYSQTINNEKNLVRLLTSELSAEIINELIRSSNEL